LGEGKIEQKKPKSKGKRGRPGNADMNTRFTQTYQGTGVNQLKDWGKRIKWEGLHVTHKKGLKEDPRAAALEHKKKQEIPGPRLV